MSDQLKQLVELHKAAEQAMKGFIVRLWPGGTLQDTLIVHLGVAMLLALRRPFLHQLHDVHLGLVHLRTGDSPACTFDADGPLDDFQPWAGIHKPPHQAEVAVGKGVARPHPDYKALHGLFGRFV